MNVRRSTLKALTLACSSALGACTFSGSLVTPYAPSLWLARSPNDLVDYSILGSVHQGYWRFYPLPAVIEKAFERADSLLVELESGRRFQELIGRFAPLVRQPAGRTLENEIGTTHMRRLITLSRADHAQIARLQNLRPWAVLLELHSPADLRLQTQTRQGLDSYFLNEAYRRHKPVLELETVDEQVHALSGGSSEEQIALLSSGLDSMAAWDEVLKEIIDAWRVGDDLRMATLRERHFPSNGPAKTYRERMLTVRDSTMAQRLLAHSQQAGTTPGRHYFVLVGAMHLVGPSNMRNELERLGFHLSRINTAA
jgi:uncharacterized protein